MLELLKKTMLSGVGLALVAKDEIESLAKELGNKMNMTEAEGISFFKELQSKYDDAQKKLEERVEKTVKGIMKKADIVTQDELKALKREIIELKKAIGKSSD